MGVCLSCCGLRRPPSEDPDSTSHQHLLARSSYAPSYGTVSGHVGPTSAAHSSHLLPGGLASSSAAAVPRPDRMQVQRELAALEAVCAAASEAFLDLGALMEKECGKSGLDAQNNPKEAPWSLDYARLFGEVLGSSSGNQSELYHHRNENSDMTNNTESLQSDWLRRIREADSTERLWDWNTVRHGNTRLTFDFDSGEAVDRGRRGEMA